jgi:UDP-2,4-diacetamido-2,4,6-trideoxy-beta-L-altropyranose hydrolase
MRSDGFVFRVDSSKKIGSGHLMRCLTLASGLQEKGATCTFICRDLIGNLNRLVVSAGFSLVELPRPNVEFVTPAKGEPSHGDWREVDWKIDALETSRALSGLKANWLIIDHYGLWHDWQLIVSDHVGKIMVIDDLGDRKHYCDLLLDQNFGSDLLLYRDLVPERSRNFFGPKYALLRPEFSAYRASSLEQRNGGQLKNILINFGGGDPHDYIARTLRALLNVDLSKEVTISIIFGGLGSLDERHKSLISKFLSKVKTYGMTDKMAEVLAGMDLVIGAAGSSSWERCCLGVPSIVFPVAFNQNRIAENLAGSGAALALDPQDLLNGKLAGSVNDFLQGNGLKSMSVKASRICDGSGREKIVNELRS